MRNRIDAGSNRKGRRENDKKNAKQFVCVSGRQRERKTECVNLFVCVCTECVCACGSTAMDVANAASVCKPFIPEQHSEVHTV